TDNSLLQSPVRLVSEPNIFSSMKGTAKVVENRGDSAEWEWSGESEEVSVTSKLKADCDGFCWYEIQIKPKRPVTLRSLTLEIPRVKTTARYLHTANYSWSNLSQGLLELKGKWSGGFMPYIWMGDEDRGLAWCAESDEGYRLSDPGRALRIDTQG